MGHLLFTLRCRLACAFLLNIVQQRMDQRRRSCCHLHHRQDCNHCKHVDDRVGLDVCRGVSHDRQQVCRGHCTGQPGEQAAPRSHRCARLHHAGQPGSHISMQTTPVYRLQQFAPQLLLALFLPLCVLLRLALCKAKSEPEPIPKIHFEGRYGGGLTWRTCASSNFQCAVLVHRHSRQRAEGQTPL